MLLSHTAGLPDGGDLFGNRESDALEKYVREEVPTLPFVAPHNTMYSYGNSNGKQVLIQESFHELFSMQANWYSLLVG
jgi:hypothetical protein